jgi:hypothetical protein
MGQAAPDATWEKGPNFTDASPSFELEDELFHKGEGECCGCLHWKDIPAPAEDQAQGINLLVVESE